MDAPLSGWTAGLFDGPDTGPGPRIPLAEGAFLLPGFALGKAGALLKFIGSVETVSPFRQMVTPGGRRMSAAMTNCGRAGWVTDEGGYRYSERDPESRRPWPALSPEVRALGQAAALAAGYPDFPADACVINRYAPGARMSLHQDRNEQDLNQPIVSISLGLPAIFLFGGMRREDPTQRRQLQHGDVVVWGGPARLRFHGVQPIKHGVHPEAGAYRFNMTLRATTPRHSRP